MCGAGCGMFGDFMFTTISWRFPRTVQTVSGEELDLQFNSKCHGHMDCVVRFLPKKSALTYMATKMEGR